MIETINQIAQSWIQFFGTVLIRNTAFLMLIFIMLAALRRTPVGWKYSIAVAGLIKCLVPPFLKYPVVSTQSAPIVQAILTPVFVERLSVGRIQGAVQTVPVSTPVLDLNGALFLLWTVSVALILGTLVLSMIRIRSILRTAKPLTDAYLRPLIKRYRIRLFMSDRIRMPLTAGLISRNIYVPSQWKSWSDGCREMVLLHEIAHLRRHDGIVRIVQSIVKAVYFFHPLIWLLNRRLNTYREMACDDCSLQTGRQSSIEYSRFLVQVAERWMVDTIKYESVSTLIRKRNELLRRVSYQMKEDKMATPKRWQVIPVGLVMILSFLTVSWTGRVQHDKLADTRLHTAAVKNESNNEHTRSSYVIMIPVMGKQACAEPVLIRIDTDGEKISYFLRGEMIRLSKLGDELEAVAEKAGETFSIRIQPSADTRMKSIFDLQNLLRGKNILRIGIAPDGSDASKQIVSGNRARVEEDPDSSEELRVALPRLKDDEIIASIPKKNLSTFLIRASGALFHEGSAVDYNDVPELVKKALAANQALIVVLRCEADTKSSDYIRLLDLVKKGGAPRIFIDNTPAPEQ